MVIAMSVAPRPVRPLVFTPQFPIVSMRPVSFDDPLIVVPDFRIVPHVIIPIIRIVDSIADADMSRAPG
jgi:hypothetical protein